LASQRTAFAIAGDGPIQSDLFPILEYAAPRAFYIGESSHMLVQYDERTRQQLLAPEEKTAILRALPANEVQSVFSEYASVNRELVAAVHGDPNISSVFNANSAEPMNSSVVATTLNQAVTALNAGDLDKAEKLTEEISKESPADPISGYIQRIIARQRSLKKQF